MDSTPNTGPSAADGQNYDDIRSIMQDVNRVEAQCQQFIDAKRKQAEKQCRQLEEKFTRAARAAKNKAKELDEAIKRLEKELADLRDKKERSLQNPQPVVDTSTKEDQARINEECEKAVAELERGLKDYTVARFNRLPPPANFPPPELLAALDTRHTKSPTPSDTAGADASAAPRGQKRPAQDDHGSNLPAEPPKKRQKQERIPVDVATTIRFDEVYCNGEPKHKFEIVDWPATNGGVKWYILKCEQHGLCFGGNGKQAVLGAAKHLGSKDHDGDGSFAKHRAAIISFGIEVLDCDAEKAKLNNDMVKPFVGVTDPEAGACYTTTYKRKRWAVMLMPLDDFSEVGVQGSFAQSTLAKSVPKCYTKLENGQLGWAKGYEDGGPLVQSRIFPVMHLSEERTLQWVPAHGLRMVDLGNATECEAIVNAKEAVEIYAQMKGNKPVVEEEPVVEEPAAEEVDVRDAADAADPASEASSESSSDDSSESSDAGSDSTDDEDSDSDDEPSNPTNARQSDDTDQEDGSSRSDSEDKSEESEGKSGSESEDESSCTPEDTTVSTKAVTSRVDRPNGTPHDVGDTKLTRVEIPVSVQNEIYKLWLMDLAD
ncbi:hypothetical protein QBC47DRAFT_404265 [Echria macrotheca]|uniref:Uncharacterized protein n=1 Tax=Echria macrotheca TaxID=438768 RepID=A0AAJ0B7Z4_9PEZI|nr:hypothetical protein QBC47DRAFT_404265 [Echria macrotheca]